MRSNVSAAAAADLSRQLAKKKETQMKERRERTKRDDEQNGNEKTNS